MARQKSICGGILSPIEGASRGRRPSYASAAASCSACSTVPRRPSAGPSPRLWLTTRSSSRAVRDDLPSGSAPSRIGRHDLTAVDAGRTATGRLCVDSGRLRNAPVEVAAEKERRVAARLPLSRDRGGAITAASAGTTARAAGSATAARRAARGTAASRARSATLAARRSPSRRGRAAAATAGARRTATCAAGVRATSLAARRRGAPERTGRRAAFAAHGHRGARAGAAGTSRGASGATRVGRRCLPSPPRRRCRRHPHRGGLVPLQSR